MGGETAPIQQATAESDEATFQRKLNAIKEAFVANNMPDVNVKSDIDPDTGHRVVNAVSNNPGRSQEDIDRILASVH